jgi:2-aminoadipate transaminase
LVKAYGFEKIQCHRLWLEVVENYERAHRLYESEGFSDEGLLRDSLRRGNGFVSLRIMAILKHEYEDAKNGEPEMNITRIKHNSALDEQSWIDGLLSDRTGNMEANEIREILKVTAQPHMISLAGGLPAPESFPLNVMKEIVASVLRDYAASSLQYSPTEGLPPLREILTVHVKRRGVQATVDEIAVSSGSQGTLDAIGRILIDKGDFVAVESPTYLGAITAFNPYEPRYLELDTDDAGLVPEALDRTLSNHPVKFVYLIPTYQNPSGRTIPFERRRQIADIIRQHDTLLVEDDAYGHLRYRGQDILPIKTLAPERVIYLGTMSKILAPGLRIGFCVAPRPIVRWLVLSKQGVDLHTSSFDQAVAAKFLAGGYLDHHLLEIVSIYRPRLEAMLKALETHFPSNFRWSKPDGGMFVWAEGPPGLDTSELYRRAIDEGVAFVPGRHFYTSPGRGLETMRLNFSNAREDSIKQAIEILGGLIKEFMKA